MDYYEALCTLDRGSDLLPPIAVEGPSEVGIIGTTILVVREGQAKGRVMLSSLAADYLLRDDQAAIGLGIIWVASFSHSLDPLSPF